ncbi:GLPGLI family protein [Lutibacter flavus]|uniref:GLPGLI family protein n=1 Tax=Lutibacter flavus TaxID=691689 RepID=A0A238XUR9_9FLAO|nr:GLPGLI family protein [Lutibacter flavus]SNR62472.1 GLPGLI family protein [Lutibacter flavus]
MKTLYLFLFFTSINFIGFSQNKLKDEFNYKITYNLTYKLDSTSLDKPKSELMILYLGDNLSIFSSRAKTLANPIVIRGNSGHTSRFALTKFHYEILKDNRTDKLYYTLQIPKMQDQFYYIQDKGLFNWKISEETKIIKGYKVQKATTSFAERDYIAWFSPEIPIAEGPYKFNGLPGLILEISDTDNDYVFEFIGLEKITPKLPYKINLKQYVKTEKEELLDLWHRYRSDPFTYANNPNMKISPENHKKYLKYWTEMLNKENNPLELK